MATLEQFTLPPPRSVGSPNPPVDVNNIVNCVTAYGSAFNIVNTGFAGGAYLDGTSDSTAAIQACMDAAATYGAAVFIPGGVIFRASQLTWNAGQIIQGVYSGTYPGEDSITTASILARLASTNEDLITVPDGTDYGMIRDLMIDGNKSNNSAGDGVHIADGISDQECQIVIERCYIHDNPGSAVYLGNNRRGTKVLTSVLHESGIDGVTIAGSDNHVWNCIIGDNTRAGICLGTTITQNWAATSGFAFSVAHIGGNDIFKNGVGIAIASGVNDVTAYDNGIDHSQKQGITVYDGSANSLVLNSLHSNSQAANNTYAHIDVGANVTSVSIDDNNFGPLDSDATNAPSYCVNAATGIATGTILGNLGSMNATSTVGGLINSAANTDPYVCLSNAGALIKGSGNNILSLKNASGTLVTKVSNGGSFVHQGGAFQATATGGGHVFGSATALPNTALSVIGNTAANPVLGIQAATSQIGDLLDFWSSGGSPTLLQAVDFTGAMPGLYLCTPTQYAPGSQVTFSSTAQTFSAVSSANINTRSFTAPASGEVLVGATLTSQVNSDGNTVAFALAEHGTTTPLVSTASVLKYPGSAFPFPLSLPFLVSDLAAGSAYTFDLMWCVASGGTVTAYAYGQTGTTPTQGNSGLGGPAIMTVQAA